MSILEFNGAKKKSDGKLIMVDSENVNRQWFYEDDTKVIVYVKNLERNQYTKSFAKKWLKENTNVLSKIDENKDITSETHDSASESDLPKGVELTSEVENSPESYENLSYDDILELAKEKFGDIKGRPSKSSLIEKLKGVKND